jgi:hypothetical protein
MIDTPPASEVLGAMITPAVLISASGTLVLSTSNRLGRIVDRVRTLTNEAEQLIPVQGAVVSDALLGKRDLIDFQLTKLSKRIRLMVKAITTLYMAIGLLVATSVATGIVSFFRWEFSWFPILFGLSGSGMLFYASTILVKEARLAVETTLHEMNYVRSVVERKMDRKLFGIKPPDKPYEDALE